MTQIVTTAGVRVTIKNRGKETKLIPWSLVKKETIEPAIKRCTAPRYGVDVYIVDKKVGGNRFTGCYDTEKEALKAVDIFLIKNGREPKYILRKK